MPLYPSPWRTIPPFDPKVDQVLDNHAGTADPLVTDDKDSGYAISSRWINTAIDRAFVLVDNTPSAAVWIQIGGASGVGADHVVDDLSAQANGILTTLTFAASAISGTVIVTRRGMTLRLGVDYTLPAANQVDFTSAPLTGDTVVVVYVPA